MTLKVEIGENEIFADSLGSNVNAIERILTSTSATYELSANFSLSFSHFPDKFPKPIAGVDNFDAMIDQSIALTYGEYIPLSSTEMLAFCEQNSPFGR